MGSQELTVRKRVVLIEDDPCVCSLIAAILEETVDVTVLHEGAAGIARVVAMLPDLVLCDGELPDIPGRDVIAALKDNPLTVHIPVLVVSGGDPNIAASRADGFIAKPFAPMAFVQTVLDTIQSAAQRPELAAA